MDHNGRIQRKRFIFSGIIQGVGFRPSIYRSAAAAGVGGFVQNRRSVVVAEAEGEEKSLKLFETFLRENIPKAARVDHLEIETIDTHGESEFRIVESTNSDYLFPPIPPDLATCDTCREELLNPKDRRYLYPFITCTQCGPRYSIVEDTPFDRETTSMAEFHQCPECLREYRNPLDRRFHSQTNSCSVCGPAYTWISTEKSSAAPPFSLRSSREEPSPVTSAIRALGEGAVVAMQGIGGFHLAADPSHPRAVENLRREKGRKSKPFALMVRDMEEAKRLCYCTEKDEQLLQSPESPILILAARNSIPEYLNRVSDTGTLGIMLPYTPLHILLFHHPEIRIPFTHLIMTSGNHKDEPIIFSPPEAMEKLTGTADYFLFHNRRILQYSDDSILRPPLALDREAGPGPSTKKDSSVKNHCFIRRSRGYVPGLIELSLPIVKPTLALGGDLKNAPGYGAKTSFYLAPHIGDLEQPETMEAFETSIKRILELYQGEPERVICDLHPEYYSSNWASSFRGNSTPPLEIRRIQHHYAHILSVMAEHGLTETIGLACDGTGYGTDGTVWGCEFIHARRQDFRRLGSLKPFRLPGGEAAINHPKRIALSLLLNHFSEEEAAERAGFSLTNNGKSKRKNSPEEDTFITEESLAVLTKMVRESFNSPLTSSAGRLFDAAAAVLGLVETVTYEGEGPMKLEAAATGEYRKKGFIDSPSPDLTLVSEEEGFFTLDPLPLIHHISEQRDSESVGHLALLFHQQTAAGLAEGIRRISEKTGMKRVCLSGGVFQNMLLKACLERNLDQRKYNLHWNIHVPPGDGGIALGQAYAL